MKKLDYVPTGKQDIIKYYGNPDPDEDGNFNSAFWKRQMEKFALPYPMVIGWKPEKRVEQIWMHRKIGAVVVDALDEIGTYMSGDPQYLVRNGLNKYWGCFAFRFQRGANVYSTHSWGIAIDLNRHLGDLGEQPEQPEWFVGAFKRRGFIWGGDWKKRPDGMHFQACRGY